VGRPSNHSGRVKTNYRLQVDINTDEDRKIVDEFLGEKEGVNIRQRVICTMKIINAIRSGEVKIVTKEGGEIPISILNI